MASNEGPTVTNIPAVDVDPEEVWESVMAVLSPEQSLLLKAHRMHWTPNPEGVRLTQPNPPRETPGSPGTRAHVTGAGMALRAVGSTRPWSYQLWRENPNGVPMSKLAPFLWNPVVHKNPVRPMHRAALFALVRRLEPTLLPTGDSGEEEWEVTHVPRHGLPTIRRAVFFLSGFRPGSMGNPTRP